jgi:hypothetical protein
VGLLNGLMPCGPLQTMQVYALGTGSVAAGALSMFLFSVGTVPLLLGFGALSSLLSASFSRRMAKAGGVLVAALGLVMFGRGLNLFGIGLPGLTPAAVGSVAQPGGTAARDGGAAVARLSGGVQEVTTRVLPGSYQPFVVQQGIPVRWTIEVKAADLNGCNNPLTVPAYGIRRELAPGKNVVEFTPDRAGTLSYTCWMGMISSTIRVVPDLAQVSTVDPRAAAFGAAPAGGAACSCCATP